MKNNTKTIEIFGAGLLGVLLSYKLANHELIKEKKIRIKLIEKTNKILNGWNSIEINGSKFDNGFHGIEMPRAELMYEQFISIIDRNALIRKENNRMVLINQNIINYGEECKNWPEDLRVDLSRFLKLRKRDTKIDYEQIVKENLNEYKLGKIIQNCSKRFSDSLINSWHLFYPWFFPCEFENKDKTDEGTQFREKVRKKILKPYYFAPKSGIFSDFSSVVEKELIDSNIEVIKNQEFNLDYKINSPDTKRIWASSSIQLLYLFNNKVAKSLVESKRKFFIALFSISFDLYKEWYRDLKCEPSEILCLVESIPQLNRISFPSYSENNLPKKVLLRGEFFIDNEEFDNDLLKKTKEFMRLIFNGNVKIEGKCFGRVTYSINKENTAQCEKEVLEIAKKNNLFLPHIYWGPINMTKCGSESEKISSILINQI